MDPGAAARPQHADRVFDQGAAAVGEQGLGAAAEAPSAAGGQQQSDDLALGGRAGLVAGPGPGLVVRHVPLHTRPDGCVP